ncbi:hypothetical protein EV360DRAFT_71130 [Lentinula raphanica]|nr:hypothetical protein EV360DRAFT_71130 [Lentinula raphanica]
MYRYSRARSRTIGSSHLLFTVLLLAMLIGTCIASPVPSESETDAPVSPQFTGSDHLHERRAFKQTVKNGFKKMKFWGSNEDEKDTDTASAEGGQEKTVLGYTYHVHNQNGLYDRANPASTHAGDWDDKQALQRLEKVMVEFQQHHFVPYFPGPNYYRKFLNPKGNLFYYQGKTLINLDKFNQSNPVFAFIPATTECKLESLTAAAVKSHQSKVTTRTGNKIETEQRETGLNFGNAVIILELFTDRYAILVARGIIDNLMRYPDNAAITSPLIDSL